MRIIDLRVTNHSQAAAFRKMFRELDSSSEKDNSLVKYLTSVVAAETKSNNGTVLSSNDEDKLMKELKTIDITVNKILSIGFYREQKGAVVYIMDKMIRPDSSLKSFAEENFIGTVNLQGWSDTLGNMKITQQLAKRM